MSKNKEFMKVIASCGHRLTYEEFDYSYSWKCFTRDCKEAVCSGSLCFKCAERMKKDKELLAIHKNGKTTWKSKDY